MSKTRIIVVGNGAAGHTAQTIGAELRAARITDYTILEEPPRSSVFDDHTDTWALSTAAGETLRGRVVIAADPSTLVPWIPELPGRKDFRGVSIAAARWASGFDPAGKHIAVIGADSTAGHHVARLVESAASVTVFAHAPRRIVQELPLPATRVKRWLRRHTRLTPPAGPAAALVGAAIETLTPSGIRTADGVDHAADAIVYGTGFSISDQLGDEALVGAGGLTIRHAWADGVEPYFGVAVHGFPNYFFVTGPDSKGVAAQVRYAAECLCVMQRVGSTRIEVRRSSQQVFNERIYVRPAQPHRVSRAFETFASPGKGTDADEIQEIYAGAATLTIAGTGHPVRVRLTGHLNPIDGHYHWQGTVFGSLPDEALQQARGATLSVGDRSAPARIVEKTPSGTHSVTGIGAPPYALPVP